MGFFVDISRRICDAASVTDDAASVIDDAASVTAPLTDDAASVIDDAASVTAPAAPAIAPAIPSIIDWRLIALTIPRRATTFLMLLDSLPGDASDDAPGGVPGVALSARLLFHRAESSLPTCGGGSALCCTYSEPSKAAIAAATSAAPGLAVE